jgi:hypothetical protein
MYYITGTCAIHVSRALGREKKRVARAGFAHAIDDASRKTGTNRCSRWGSGVRTYTGYSPFTVTRVPARVCDQ